jgi:trk system potassium uptake protein TrkH
MPRNRTPQAATTISMPRANLSWPQQRALAGSLLAAWIALMAWSYVSLRHHGVMVDGQELAPTRALFLSVNAGTLTGFQQAIGINEFNPENSQGAATVLVVMVVGSLFAMIVGTMAVVRMLRLDYSIWQIILSAFLFEFLAAMAGAAAIIHHGRTLFDAVFQSAAAFGNCGLATGSVSGARDGATYVLLVLAVLGGLGLPVLMELYDALWGLRSPSAHSRRVLRCAAAVYLLAFLALLLCQWPPPESRNWSGWQQVIATSNLEAINSRTAGMHFERIDVLPRAAQWLLIVLMAVGASSAGTGGGIKSNTFVQLWRGVRNVLRGLPVGRDFGIACVWLTAYAMLALTGLLVLLIMNDELAADQMLFVVVSAVSNVGLSHNPIAVTGASLHILSALMLLGRLTPLCILWWMAETTNDADLAVA